MSVYSNMALAEVAKENNVSGNAAQFMIEAHRLDLSLFNAVIECDFLDAMGKAGLIAFTEADQETSKSVRKDGIISKIKVLIEKAVAFVLKKAGELKTALDSLTGKDKAMYAKFEKVITDEKIKGCPVKGNVPVYAAFEKIGDAIADIEIEKAMSAVDAATDVAGVDAAVEDYKKKVSAMAENISKKEAKDAYFNTEDKAVVEKMSGDDITKMKECLRSGYKSTITYFNSLTNAAKRNLDITKKSIEQEKKSTTDELALAKLNGKGTCVSTAVGFITKYTSFGMSLTKEMVTCYRRIFAQLGVYATKGVKQASEEAKEETATEAFTAAMLSDEVVEEAFAL